MFLPTYILKQFKSSVAASDMQRAGASSGKESDWYYLKLVTEALEGDNNTDLYLEDDFTTGNCKG